MCRSGQRYSIADQTERYARAVSRNDQRVLNISKFFDKSLLKGKRVLVVGASRGLGLEIAKELHGCGATTIGTVVNPSAALSAVGISQIVTGIDVTSDENVSALAEAIAEPIDAVIMVAGYFYGPVEKLDSLVFKEEVKMIDICGLGTLRVVSALVNASKIKHGGKICLITSQAGSIAWRSVQNPAGTNYGHHASRAVTNMYGRLLSLELKDQYSVQLIHPGFNRTDMTLKYKDIWDVEGAVDPSVGAQRVLHELNEMSLSNTGKFINAEDGLEIPW